MGDVSEDIVLSGEKLKVVFSGDWELRVIFLHLGQNLHNSTKKVKVPKFGIQTYTRQDGSVFFVLNPP